MLVEQLIFLGLLGLIIWTAYRIGYERAKGVASANLPLYRAMVAQATILNLAMMGYLRTTEENGKVVILPLDDGEQNVTEEHSRPEEKS